MINDPSINVYEVVAEAESYFQNIDKNAKGSGWKAYNRWLYENEPKFYPSGDRSSIDPFFVSKEYLKNNIPHQRSLFEASTSAVEAAEVAVESSSMLRRGCLKHQQWLFEASQMVV